MFKNDYGDISCNEICFTEMLGNNSYIDMILIGTGDDGPLI